MLDKREDTNELLAAVSKHNNVVYLKSELAFKDKGPVEKIYYKDKIHLSDYGVSLFCTWLHGRIGSLMGLPPQWDPTTGKLTKKK
jgi:hypothetical protein